MTATTTPRPTIPPRFENMAAVRRANRVAGYHWFDRDTMQFFGSRVVGSLRRGRWFITSERSGFDHDSPRRFSVREALPGGGIETVGEFGGHRTRAAASAAIDDLVAAGVDD